MLAGVAVALVSSVMVTSVEEEFSVLAVVKFTSGASVGRVGARVAPTNSVPSCSGGFKS